MMEEHKKVKRLLEEMEEKYTEHSDNCVRFFIGISVYTIPQLSDLIIGIVYTGRKMPLWKKIYSYIT